MTITDINENNFSSLASLCKIDFAFTDSEQAEYINALNAVAAFVSKVKSFEPSSDANSAQVGVSFDSLREDVAQVTATPAQLLANTVSDKNCYYIPRVIE